MTISVFPFIIVSISVLSVLFSESSSDVRPVNDSLLLKKEIEIEIENKKMLVLENGK